MKWHLLIEDPTGSRLLEQHPNIDYDPGIIGTKSVLVQKIKTLAPAIAFEGDVGVLKESGCTLTIVFGSHEDIRNFSMIAEGDLDLARGCVLYLMRELGLYAREVFREGSEPNERFMDVDNEQTVIDLWLRRG